MKILVTGATGQLGWDVVKELKKEISNAAALRNISLADLPWEKYYDPLKADKFGEQLLMVMYICQNEKTLSLFLRWI